jgi:RNA polymerase sigma-B factor
MVVEMWATKAATGGRHTAWSLPDSRGQHSQRPGLKPASPQRQAAARRRRGAARAAARRDAARRLLRAYHERGDTAARDRLIRQYLPLVRKLARRHVGRGEQLEDLVQVGSIGLINAIDRFELDRGVDLATFAIPTIDGEIKRHLRDRAWPVRIPRRIQELDPSFRARATELVEDMESGLEQDGVLEKGYELGEDRAALAQSFRVLDERERQLLHLGFFKGWSQSRIASEVGISQIHVSRLTRRALTKLRAEIGYA